MRTLLTGVFLFAVMTVCGGVMKPEGGRTFRLPSGAAPGGTVTAELRSDKPLCIRLNGKILGYFKGFPYNPEPTVGDKTYSPKIITCPSWDKDSWSYGGVTGKYGRVD